MFLKVLIAVEQIIKTENTLLMAKLWYICIFFTSFTKN